MLSQEKLGGGQQNITLWIKYHKREFYLGNCFLLTNLENTKESRNVIERKEGNIERIMIVVVNLQPGNI